MDVPARFGFYGILTNPMRGYAYLAELFVDHEVRFIQLRMKKETRRERYHIAESLRRITDGTRSLFIVNDDVQMAADVCADGAHIGQDDLPVEDARKILAPGAIIGLSTHNPKQTEAACRKLPAYIGVGPVYPTPTKVIADPVLGIATMKEMVALSTVPAVVIGGIDQSNLRDVIRGGAVNFCSVRTVNATLTPEKALKALLKTYRDETGF